MPTKTVWLAVNKNGIRKTQLPAHFLRTPILNPIKKKARLLWTRFFGNKKTGLQWACFRTIPIRPSVHKSYYEQLWITWRYYLSRDG